MTKPRRSTGFRSQRCSLDVQEPNVNQDGVKVSTPGSERASGLSKKMRCFTKVLPSMVSVGAKSRVKSMDGLNAKSALDGCKSVDAINRV